VVIGYILSLWSFIKSLEFIWYIFLFWYVAWRNIWQPWSAPGRFGPALAVSQPVDEEPVDGVAVLELDAGLPLDQPTVVANALQRELLAFDESERYKWKVFELYLNYTFILYNIYYFILFI
jgi:hypothetical protein